MQRRILIIDDHDDMRSNLARVFSETGYFVETMEARAEAMAPEVRLEGYDLVVTDLDDCHELDSLGRKKDIASCLPDAESNTIKAFKICAANYNREGFNEEEIKYLFETILAYKAEFIDKAESIQSLREKIEFEFPSTISLMHSILDYLVKRIENLGVVRPEDSNLFIALDEAFVNAVKHGNKFDSGKIVKISADISPEEARFTFEDEGDGFDISKIPDPLDPENLFKTSGRGVLIIHNVMDEVAYNDRGNRVTMVKHSKKPETLPA